MRSKQKSLRAIGDVLATACGTHVQKRMRNYEIWEAWPTIVGEAIARHAQPSEWRRQTLVVRVAHHAWLQELSLLKRDIQEKIATRFPHLTIRELRFELGNPGDFEPPPAAALASPKYRALSPEEHLFAHDTTKDLADDEVRKLVKRIIEKDLAKQR